MSRRNSRHAKSIRRGEKAERHNNRRGVAAVIGMTTTNDEDEIERCKRDTHDHVVRVLAGIRLSGVRWRVVRPPDVETALTAFIEHSPIHAGLGYEEWLAGHPDAVLVIAMADALKPEGT